ncbi:MAG: hypothetical protein GYA35_04825 [Thermoanaerobaculaceae bacterium]|nr:hypothetical protein [Thermoanaerobaculaceae bacterium]
MKSVKLTASIGLFLLISATSAATFHHHDGFDDHRDGCSICLISANLLPVAVFPIIFLILFVCSFSILIFSKIKPISSKIFSAFGRAPPNLLPL